MTIRTIEEYRAFIDKTAKEPTTHRDVVTSYYKAGYLGAATAARKVDEKVDKKVKQG